MTEEYVEVRVVGYPIAIWHTAQEHIEELRREFALLMMGPATSDVPQRLLELIEDLTQRFGATSEAANAERDAAAARGEETIDLTFHVPPVVREATIGLARMLDEADEFCRAGRQLLTLATPVPALAFRRWYLAEFVRQIDGLPPRPWPGVDQALAIEVEPATA